MSSRLFLDHALLVPAFPNSLIISVNKLVTSLGCGVMFNQPVCVFQDVTHQSVEMVSIFLMFQSYWHSHLSKLKCLVPSLKYVPSLDCDSCQVSVHLRASFPVSQSSKSFKLFDVIHLDVWRNVPNHSRFKYCVIFIDGFSRMSWLFL